MSVPRGLPSHSPRGFPSHPPSPRLQVYLSSYENKYTLERLFNNWVIKIKMYVQLRPHVLEHCSEHCNPNEHGLRESLQVEYRVNLK